MRSHLLVVRLLEERIAQRALHGKSGAGGHAAAATRPTVGGRGALELVQSALHSEPKGEGVRAARRGEKGVLRGGDVARREAGRPQQTCEVKVGQRAQR